MEKKRFRMLSIIALIASAIYTLAIHFKEIYMEVEAGGTGVLTSIYFLVKSPIAWVCLVIYILCYRKELKQWYGFPEFKIKNILGKTAKNMITPFYLKMLGVFVALMLILYLLSRLFSPAPK